MESKTNVNTAVTLHNSGQALRKDFNLESRISIFSQKSQEISFLNNCYQHFDNCFFLTAYGKAELSVPHSVPLLQLYLCCNAEFKLTIS